MVKNTGGKMAKKFARKDTGIKVSSKIRLSEDPDEIYACVTKLHGNTCDVVTVDNAHLVGHIRGCMSGKKKRFCIIGTNTIVLIGVRSWESSKKHCDILEVYSSIEVEQLRNIPKINLDRLNQYMTESNGSSKQDDGNITFSNETASYIDDIASNTESKNEETFTMENTEEIDIDDI